MSRKHDAIDKIDNFIGSKICNLRIARGMSRQQLGEIIGVTHQQLQKYEKGTNRISAGRLVLVARALNRNINYFYDDLDGATPLESNNGRQRMCMEVSRNFMKLENPSHQDAVNALIKSLVKQSA